jgi:hypothetical protein
MGLLYVLLWSAVRLTAGLQEDIGPGEDCIMSSFMVCADYQMLLGRSNGVDEFSGACGTYGAGVSM